MISEKSIAKVEYICYSVASSFFSTFCNAKNRGANFTWEDFPDMVARQSSLQVSLSNIPRAQVNEARKYAERLAVSISKEMTVAAGFVSKVCQGREDF